MLKLVARRLLSGLPVLFIVSLIVFLLTFLVPGDPAFTIAGGDNASAEFIEQTRERLGLNRPVLEQYGDWLGSALRGDFGSSLYSSLQVTDAIVSRLPVTLSLTAGGLLFAISVGMPAGIVSAMRRGRLTDRLITLGTSVGVAMPGYFLALILVLLFAIAVPWLPATGYVAFTDGPMRWAQHLLLPSIALGSTSAAVIARQLRSSLVDVLSADYIRTARAKGLRGRVVVVKHGVKNAMAPVVTVMGTQVAAMLGGSILIETIFALPGIGDLAITAVVGRDIPVIQGVVLFTAVVVLASNLLVDISYGWLNPKVRKG